MHCFAALLFLVEHSTTLAWLVVLFTGTALLLLLVVEEGKVRTAVLEVEELITTLLGVGVGILIEGTFGGSGLASATLVLIVVTTATFGIP